MKSGFQGQKNRVSAGDTINTETPQSFPPLHVIPSVLKMPSFWWKEVAKVSSSGKLLSLLFSGDGEAGVEKNAGEMHDEVGEWGMS